MTTREGDVREGFRAMFGTSLMVEETGGGCTVLLGVLEGGLTVVLNDDAMCHTLVCEGWSVGVYAPGEWMHAEDTFEPVTQVSGFGGVVEIMGAVLSCVLGAARMISDGEYVPAPLAR